MSILTRTQLKALFETGDTPTQQNFSDWIDSYLHLSDSNNGVFVGSSGQENQLTITSNISGQTGTAAFTALDWDVTVGARSASGAVHFADWKKDSTSTFQVDIDGNVNAGNLTAYSWIGDLTTKLYQKGAGDIALATLGVDAIEISPTQDVNIENGILTVRDGDASVTPNTSSVIVAETNTALSTISIVGTSTHRGILMFGDNGDSFIGGIEYAHNTDEMKITVNNSVAIGINSSLDSTFNGIIYTKSYTVATLPSAAVAAGFIYVTDESGGATHASSDGTNWRRVSDRAIVS